MSNKKFKVMRESLMADPAFRAEVVREKAMMAEIDLRLARETSGMTQEAVAAAMGKSQENVSRIERERDVRVSTLAALIQAQGGELEINAVFGKKRISLMGISRKVKKPVGQSTAKNRAAVPAYATARGR